MVSRLGRGESPADPAGPNEADVIATLKPIEDRPRDLTQEKIADQMRDRLARIPGINLVMSQPISDRVDEMVTGVRADVAVKIFGDDLDTLIEKARADCARSPPQFPAPRTRASIASVVSNISSSISIAPRLHATASTHPT